MDDVYKVLPDEFDEGAVYDAIKATANNLDVRNQAVESRATSPWLCLDLLRMQHDFEDLGTMPVSWRKVKA